MKLHHSLFHKIRLSIVDPLGAGLAEEIVAEQSEPDAIVLEENPDAEKLSEQWERMVEDLHQDPTWFDFAEDE